MKVYTILICLLLQSTAIWGQEKSFVEEGQKETTVIQITKHFHGWTHCNLSDEPSLKSIEIDGDELDFESDDTCFYYLPNTSSDKTIKFNLEVNHIDDNKKASLSHKLSIGKQSTESISKTSTCLWKHEGYSFSADLVVDCPIIIQALNSDPLSLSIDKGEQLRIEVGDFYDEDIVNAYILYKLSSDNNWKKLSSTKKIRKNSVINISYEDIVGEPSASNNNYINCSGKKIDIKVMKKMIDKTWSESNILQCVFYHRGPQFELSAIRRTACDPSSITFTAKIKNNSKLYSNNKVFKWEIAGFVEKENEEIENYIYSAHVESFEDNECGEYTLKLEGKDWLKNEQLLKSKEDKWWIMQLQTIDGIDYSNLSFAKQWFQIPPKLLSVEVEQDKTYTIKRETKEYNSVSTSNAYAVLKINDPNKNFEERLPYIIKNEKDESIDTIYNLPLSFGDLSVDEQNNEKSDFLKEIEGQKESFIKSKLRIWYNEKVVQQSDSVRIVKTTGTDKTIQYSMNPPCFFVSTNYLFCLNSGNWTSSDAKISRYTFSATLSDSSFPRSFSLGTDMMIYADQDGFLYYVTNQKRNRINTDNKKTFLSLISHTQDNILARDGDKLYTFTVGTTYTTCSIFSEHPFTSFENLYKQSGGVIYQINEDIIEKYESKNNNWEKTGTYNAVSKPSYKNVTFTYDRVTYKSNDGNWYCHYNVPIDFKDLYNYFLSDKTLLESNRWEKAWNNYKEYLWRMHVLEKYGYHFKKLNAFVRETDGDMVSNGKLALYDIDGCPTYFEYEVRVPEEPRFEKSNEVKPTSHCSNDGRITIKYLGGGDSPYIYGDYYLSNIGDELTVTDLKYGLNKIELISASGSFPLEHDIKSDATITVEETKNYVSCEDDKGGIAIKVSPDISDYWLLNYKGDIINKDKFQSLNSGVYTLIYKFNGCSEEFDYDKEIKIQTLPFKITKTVTNGDRLNADGAVVVNVTNQKDIITWTDASNNTLNENIVPQDGVIKYLPAGEYNWKAKQGGCSVPVDFLVKTPTIEIDKSSYVIQNDKTTEVCIRVKCDLIDDYFFEIGDEKYEKSINVKLNDLKDITIDLYYKMTGSSSYNTMHLIDISDLSLNIDAKADASNKDRCYGTDGKILILNNNSGDYDYCFGQNLEDVINDEYFESLGNKSVLDVKGEVCSITFRKKEEIDLPDGVNGSLFLYRVKTTKEIKIDSPSHISFDEVGRSDVTCYGANDGKAWPINVSGNKGDYTCLLYTDDNVFCTNEQLAPGSYMIRVSDNDCPLNYAEKPLYIEAPGKPLTYNVETIDPTCLDNDGIITVTASGGWGEYEPYEYSAQLDGDIRNGDGRVFVFNNKRAGKYNLSICDGFCSMKIQSTLNKYTNPSVKDALTDQTSCYGYSDGRIKEIMVETNGKLNGKDVTPSKLFYNFTPKNNDLYEEIKEKELPWTDGIDNLAAGDYELWVEDNNGCMTNNKDGSIGMSFTVGQPEHVQLEVKKIADVSGYGASDAVIKVRADGGNNCDKKIYVKKEETEDESAATEVREDAQSEDEYFIGEAATRGVEYQIAKYPFAEGTYSFYVRDKEKDCPSNVVNDIVVESPDEPLSADIVVRKALCHNQTGSIDITPQGGWGPPYEVIVDGVRYSATPSNPKITVGKLISGEYTVTVKDARKRVVYTTTADVPMPNDDMSFGEGTMFVADRCSGNGGAHIEIVGGSGEYNIMMDGENYTTDKFDIDGLRAGHYKIDVVDGNKCEAVLEFEIADERLSADILSYNKADDGATLEAVVAGGVEPYSYEWRHVDGLLNQRANVSVIDNLEHGIYTLLVTDAGECHAGPIAKEVVTDGDQRLEVVQLQRETGVGSADGYVVLKSGVTDFVSQKIYHIESDGSSTVSDIKVEWVDGLLKVDNLSSGDYVVKCQHSDNMHFSMARFRIEPYEKLDIEGVEVRHVTMPRNRDGRIRISLKGGIAPFAATVAHNTNAAFEPLTIESGDRCFDMERLMAGEYTLTVTDSTRREANMAVQTFVVEEPEYLSLSADMTPAMCYGEPSGKVKLTATGGWGKYMYEYASNGYEKTTEYRRLFPGMQMFSVIDEYGTRKTIEVMVEQPDEVRTQIAQIDSVDCYGSNTGSVTFQVKGGDSNYTMWYSDKNQDELLYSKAEVTHSGLSMGNYRVTFRDGNDCMSVDTITVFIPEPDLLELANDDVVNTTCELDNGKIAIEMKGGSLPYTYSWRENGEEYGGAKTLAMTRSEASGLKQNGLYSIEIVDKNGCKASYEKRIEPSENPRVLGVSTTDVLCYGSSDGVAAVDSAQVKWAYPKADYHLTWPQGQDGVMSVNTLPTGTYIVKITDDNNCSSTTEFTVGTPQPVKNHLVGLRNAMCYGYSDGRIETRTIGGVGDYRYIWSTGEETSYASNLRAGTYKVIVADSHECVDSATFEITEPEELKVNLGEDVIVCPGSSYTFDAGEFASYQWYREDADEVIETERKLTTTDGGNIHILVKNEIGCMARDTVFLGISNEALVANFFVASNVSLNDTVVAIELSNMQPDRIVWEYVNDAFNDVSPSDSTNTYRYLRTEKLGTQYITMWAYKGDCVSSDTKQVDVFENVEVFDDFEIGYDPLIKSVKVAPNPNNGEFFLIITLREVNDVVLRMTDVAGSKVMDRVLSGADYYYEKIDIGKSGIFILTLTVGDEIRSIKILSVK